MRQPNQAFPGVVMQNVHIDGGSTAIKNDGVPIILDNVSAANYSDTGLRCKNTSVFGRNLKFESTDATLGWDFERDIDANLYDSVVKGHRDADLRFGPDCRADISGVTARSLYDKARRNNPLLPRTGLQELDMSINTSQKKLQQEKNRSRLKWLLSKFVRHI